MQELHEEQTHLSRLRSSLPGTGSAFIAPGSSILHTCQQPHEPTLSLLSECSVADIFDNTYHSSRDKPHILNCVQFTSQSLRVSLSATAGASTTSHQPARITSHQPASITSHQPALSYGRLPTPWHSTLPSSTWTE